MIDTSHLLQRNSYAVFQLVLLQVLNLHIFLTQHAFILRTCLSSPSDVVPQLNRINGTVSASRVQLFFYNLARTLINPFKMRQVVYLL
jgi:hypothetical protein